MNNGKASICQKLKKCVDMMGFFLTHCVVFPWVLRVLWWLDGRWSRTQSRKQLCQSWTQDYHRWVLMSADCPSQPGCSYVYWFPTLTRIPPFPFLTTHSSTHWREGALGEGVGRKTIWIKCDRKVETLISMICALLLLFWVTEGHC